MWCISKMTRWSSTILTISHCIPHFDHHTSILDLRHKHQSPKHSVKFDWGHPSVSYRKHANATPWCVTSSNETKRPFLHWNLWFFITFWLRRTLNPLIWQRVIDIPWQHQIYTQHYTTENMTDTMNTYPAHGGGWVEILIPWHVLRVCCSVVPELDGWLELGAKHSSLISEATKLRTGFSFQIWCLLYDTALLLPLCFCWLSDKTTPFLEWEEHPSPACEFGITQKTKFCDVSGCHFHSGQGEVVCLYASPHFGGSAKQNIKCTERSGRVVLRFPSNRQQNTRI